MEFGFCGQSYESVSKIIDDEQQINLYCETSESKGARTQIALIRAEGKLRFAAITEGQVPSLYTVNGRSFTAGHSLWEIIADGTVENRGDLLAELEQPNGPTQIFANETQLLVLANGRLHVFTLATDVLTAVDMAQFDDTLVAQIEFVDGYFIAYRQNSHTFQVSQLEDGTTWDGRDKATISYFPDNITSMKVDHRELWFFSGKKSIGYYNVGAGFPPFIPIQGAFIENGCGATFATCQLDNSVFWIDEDERGGRVARRINGYVGTRVSTHAVEFAWSQYSKVSDAVAFAYQNEGHSFWEIRFPSANDGRGETWVYDVATSFWHKRASWDTNAGLFGADRATCHTYNFGKHLVGDYQTGTIYEIDSQLPDDDGRILRWLRRTPTTNDENKYAYFSEIEFDMEVGQATFKDGNGQPRPAQIILRWSDDGGYTWSNDYILNCGSLGQFKARVRKIQLGRARKRVWEVYGTDPVLIRFANAYFRATPQKL